MFSYFDICQNYRRPFERKTSIDGWPMLALYDVHIQFWDVAPSTLSMSRPPYMTRITVTIPFIRIRDIEDNEIVYRHHPETSRVPWLLIVRLKALGHLKRAEILSSSRFKAGQRYLVPAKKKPRILKSLEDRFRPDLSSRYDGSQAIILTNLRKYFVCRFGVPFLHVQVPFLEVLHEAGLRSVLQSGSVFQSEV